MIKKHLLITLVILLTASSLLQAQVRDLNDPNFENYLETHNADGLEVNLGDATSMGDGVAGNLKVLDERIRDVITLNVSNLNISSLEGIEWFISLEALICNGNQLTTLDVTTNTALKSLLCGSNELSSLQLNNNRDLETLNCSDNQIDNLDLVDVGTQTAYHPSLKSLSCSNNQLTQIDVSKNDNLSSLNVSNNRLIGTLDVSNNSNLESLFCASNQITTLDLSINTLLKNLDASSNLISSLDLTTINTITCPNPQTTPFTVCQDFGSINVSRNQLVTLNIANGYNSLISNFSAEDNPDLFCIQIDAGFSVPENWIKDDWTYYGENACTDIFTYVPDDNFEQELIAQGYDSGDLDNFVLTANINTETLLDISNKGISDLTGIEGFVELIDLNCSTNDLQVLDVSSNTKLVTLNCSDNILPSLDVATNILLENLNCSSQRPYVDADDATNNYTFSVLNITGNAALLTLNCANNTLTDLDVNTNTLLTDLDCSFNQIENLDVSNSLDLNNLNCNDNSLSALNLKNGANAGLITINATNNPDLFCIEVDVKADADAKSPANWQKDAQSTYSEGCGTYVPDDNFELELIALGYDVGPVLDNYVPTANIDTETILNISGKGISDLTGIEGFVALEDLNCSNNDLSALDVTNNTALIVLNCANNQIEDLNLTTNAALTDVLCNANALRALDVKNGTNTASLNNLDVTNNSSLFCVNVDDDVDPLSPPAGWVKDVNTSYNGDCDGSRYIPIPDPNFELALIDLGLDSGPIDGQVLLANIEHVPVLEVPNRQIENLEGIKSFTSLTRLDCSNNYLEDLDVSEMASLEELFCGNNYFLTSDIGAPNGVLNITDTDNLKRLFCSNNNLSLLDVSGNANLEELDASSNNLNALNISGNAQLKILNCSDNNLTVLDISSSVVLEEVNCNSNNISNIVGYLVNNTTLNSLSCNNNNLPALLVNRYLGLTTLNCRSNNLTALILTQNVDLKRLDFSDNNIQSITLTNNVDLVSLLCSQNDLTALELDTNVLLERLNCDDNQISQLVLSASPLLKYLSATRNQLTTLNLGSNINLIEVGIGFNQIASLTLSTNLNSLRTFNANNNELRGGLDLSTMGTVGCAPLVTEDDYCPDSLSINISNNQLDFINIQNGVNGEISAFNAISNPDLTCIQVDDVNAVNPSWQKDIMAEYSLDCRFGETFVPDDNFELALINLGYDTLPLNDYVPTANVNALISLDVSGENIADLTGIEDFVALQNLNCSNNMLSSIDVSDNTLLTEINCSQNQLVGVDFSSNTLLTTINCSNNSLTDLDLSTNTSLSDLNISDNLFIAFSPELIPSLQVFNCSGNQLTDLDLSINSNLTLLNCASNALESLNIKNGQNPSLSNLDVQNNISLTCIETDTGGEPSGVNWVKDATVEYAIDCHYGETYVPDDAFEQALIDLLYDFGPLDDYVPTSTVSALTSLDVSGKSISDLTGIEDFTNLRNLKCNDNAITTLDISSNILLERLNISNNQLTAIDISNLVALEVFEAATNSLVLIDFSSNLNLLEVNVSTNALTVLDVSILSALQKLNCSTNLLERLNVTANSNLVELICQSNLFFQDKLNIQNGANQNLAVFSATDNPDLGCILVDDPFTVIENVGGVYDNWFKDATASYQSVCEDADNDGVVNTDDLCPGTPFGEAVDLFGCPYLSLPNDNFTVLLTDEICLNSNNGKINITAKELYVYKAILESAVFYEEYNFTNDIEIRNLLAGSYSLCITIPENPGFERCYDLVINHPENLEVLSNKSANRKKVSYQLSGSSSYNVEVNGFKFTTYESQLELSLKQGENTIKISTDLECQGVHEEVVFVADDVFVYPNPFQNKVNVYLGNGKNEGAVIKIHSYIGQLVYAEVVNEKDITSYKVDTSNLATGIYTISIQNKDSFTSFKIVKK